MNTIIFYIVIGLLTLALLIQVVSIYNKLVMLKLNISKAFANIDVLLKQRADEIPNLIKIVKENMRYEEETLTKLTKLRTDFLSSTDSNKKVKFSNEINNILRSIFAVSENYPELKSNSNFLSLQQRTSEIENMIADRREFYNESVNMYNIGIAEFPALILANVMRYTKKELLQISPEEIAYNGIKF